MDQKKNPLLSHKQAIYCRFDPIAIACEKVFLFALPLFALPISKHHVKME